MGKYSRGIEMKIFIIGLNKDKDGRNFITLADIDGIVCNGDRKKEQPISDAILKTKGLL